jgi:predicted alpha/beta-fold hydrolase
MKDIRGTAHAWSAPTSAWWLPGPHLQTIYASRVRRPPRVRAIREHIPLADGDRLSVDRIRGRPDAPRLIIFHGLEGGAHSPYVRGLLKCAELRGWWADAVLWRTCDDEPVNAVLRGYHSGASDDAEAAVAWITAVDRNRPTSVIGVSLGGNVLLKWLGERGEHVPHCLRAAMTVSVPYDLAKAALQLEHGFSKIYARLFLASLKPKALAKLARFPTSVDAARVRRVRTLREFDDVFTAPVHGFRDAADYYERSSSVAFLERVRVPTLLLSAKDDPFLPREVLERVAAIARTLPHLRCEFLPRGGHVGFIAGAVPLRADYWIERRAFQWFGQFIASCELERSIHATS